MTKKVKRMAFGGALGKLAGTASNIVKSVAPAVAPKPQPGMSINPPSNRVSMNVPKSPQDQAAYTEDVQKRLAELKAPSSNANTRPVVRKFNASAPPSMAADPDVVRKFNASAPASATGGIRASNDPSNPEIAQKLADTKTYMQSVGKSDTGYEPSGSEYSSLAGASKPTTTAGGVFKKGGRVKAKAKSKSSYSSGGKVSSASKRGDGIAQRGKTKGRMV